MAFRFDPLPHSRKPRSLGTLRGVKGGEGAKIKGSTIVVAITSIPASASTAAAAIPAPDDKRTLRLPPNTTASYTRHGPCNIIMAAAAYEGNPKNPAVENTMSTAAPCCATFASGTNGPCWTLRKYMYIKKKILTVGIKNFSNVSFEPLEIDEYQQKHGTRPPRCTTMTTTETG